MKFDEMAFGFDEMVYDQVVDSIRMAFDEVVGRPIFLSIYFNTIPFMIKIARYAVR
jgi:hypothetical protein